MKIQTKNYASTMNAILEGVSTMDWDSDDTGQIIPVFGDWHPYFALKTVTTISGRKYWLKTIYRRKCLYSGWMDAHTTRDGYQYGDEFDIIASA